MTLTLLLSCLLIGLLAGLLSGTLGVGGGLIIIPGLIWLLPHLGIAPTSLMQVAAGTSFASMTVILSSTALHYFRQQFILWDWVKYLAPPLFLGIVLGAQSAVLLPSSTLKSVFAGFIFLVALRLARGYGALSNKNTQIPPPPIKLLNWMSYVIIGFISGLMGLAGGVLLIPWLHHQRLPMLQAVGTSAVCIWPASLLGVLPFALHSPTPSVPDLLGYIWWPGGLLIGLSALLFVPLGVKIALSLPTAQLRRLFALILIAISIRLLLF